MDPVSVLIFGLFLALTYVNRETLAAGASEFPIVQDHVLPLLAAIPSLTGLSPSTAAYLEPLLAWGTEAKNKIDLASILAALGLGESESSRQGGSPRQGGSGRSARSIRSGRSGRKKRDCKKSGSRWGAKRGQRALRSRHHDPDRDRDRTCNDGSDNGDGPDLSNPCNWFDDNGNWIIDKNDRPLCACNGKGKGKQCCGFDRPLARTGLLFGKSNYGPISKNQGTGKCNSGWSRRSGPAICCH